LRCPVCGCERHFSHEHDHRIRTGKLPLTPCRSCRRTKPTEQDRQFWLDRFTLDEIHELAEAIWT
jgi:hypothetical protein